MSKILVVDDEPKSVKLLRLRLEEMGHQLSSAGALEEAKHKLSSELFDLLITDVRLPDGLGTELVTFGKNQNSSMPVIVITAYGTIQDAVEAMQAGAADFVQKPFELEAMAMLVKRALDSARIRDEHSYLMDQMFAGDKEVILVGSSAPMQQVRELVDKVAVSRSIVLLSGESGTGKELVAQAIHSHSTQRDHPLIKVNCPGIPAQLFESELFGHMKGSFTGAFETRKGKFELAGKGNILLDEISEIPLELQSKLLRVIEDRNFNRVGGTAEIRVEARIIAATNRDLAKMVQEGQFRDDLFYRLNVFPIELPPLRVRKGDIAETALHLLRRIGPACGLDAHEISDEAQAALKGYHWPGNVRELRNVLERAMVIAGGGTIEIDHLPLEIQEVTAIAAGDGFASQVDAYKKSLLIDTLRSTGWSKKNAAQSLGLSQRALSHYVTKFQLDDHRD